MQTRVVITGMGTINPLGHDVASTWGALIGGVSGVGPITHFDASEMLAQIACEVKGFDPTAFMEVRDARRRDRFEQLAAVAARQALEHSGLIIEQEWAGRVGVIVSSAVRAGS